MSNEAKISIKVVVDKEKHRVAYAEADHNFVDTLFSLMTLPMGTIVRVLGKHPDKKIKALGSLHNLYQSLVDLPECYLATEECKFMLLNPENPSFDRCSKLKLKIDDSEPTKYFMCEAQVCSMFSNTVSTSNLARCSKCGKLMTEICFENSTICADDGFGTGGVFVSETTTFIVTDDLCVMPYTPGCCIQLLIDLGITELCCLEERTVDLNREKMLDLLNLALCFNSPLSDLVLHSTHPYKIFDHPVQGNFDLCGRQGSISSEIFLNVCLQKSSGKLLFAEAEEDFLEFLFSILLLPLGSILNMLKNGGTSLVCMDNLYNSISNMSEGRYMRSRDIKHDLLVPFAPQYTSVNHVLMWKKKAAPKFYLRYSDDPPPGHYILTSKQTVNRAILKDPRICGGLFKKYGMFVVTDDLTVAPSSSISTMHLLNKLKVPLNDIERHKVGIGLEEALRILKASLGSLLALTKGLEHQLKNLKK